MEKKEALNYIAQLANDYINSLPVSARQPVTQAAQAALEVLAKEEPKQN